MQMKKMTPNHWGAMKGDFAGNAVIFFPVMLVYMFATFSFCWDLILCCWDLILFLLHGTWFSVTMVRHSAMRLSLVSNESS